MLVSFDRMSALFLYSDVFSHVGSCLIPTFGTIMDINMCKSSHSTHTHFLRQKQNDSDVKKINKKITSPQLFMVWIYNVFTISYFVLFFQLMIKISKLWFPHMKIFFSFIFVCSYACISLTLLFILHLSWISTVLFLNSSVVTICNFLLYSLCQHCNIILSVVSAPTKYKPRKELSLPHWSLRCLVLFNHNPCICGTDLIPIQFLKGISPSYQNPGTHKTVAVLYPSLCCIISLLSKITALYKWNV